MTTPRIPMSAPARMTTGVPGTSTGSGLIGRPLRSS
jgi:hypothetical protein